MTKLSSCSADSAAGCARRRGDARVRPSRQQSQRTTRRTPSVDVPSRCRRSARPYEGTNCSTETRHGAGTKTTKITSMKGPVESRHTTSERSAPGLSSHPGARRERVQCRPPSALPRLLRAPDVCDASIRARARAHSQVRPRVGSFKTRRAAVAGVHVISDAPPVDEDVRRVTVAATWSQSRRTARGRARRGPWRSPSGP